jgi:hypothetical protein
MPQPYPFGSFRFAREGGKLLATKMMTGDSKHPTGFRHRAPSDYPRLAIEIVATLALAFILFVFLLFAMVVGIDVTQDDGDDSDVKTGMNGL